MNLRTTGQYRQTSVSLLAASVFIALLTGTAALAQDKTSEIDKIFSWATPTSPGCICAVSRQGNVIAKTAYGSADLERDVLLNTQSVLDAGSVVKQFVAAATLLLVEEGKLSLSDDVRKHIPQLPNYGHKITIDHLLTHTSGIRDWTGILPLTAGNEDALTLILRQRSLNFVPGAEFSYSNSGYVLLKEIVARTSGMSFEDFTRKRLFEPLGMKNTAYHTNLRKTIRNRSMAYEKDGAGWKLAMKLDNDRGGGGAMLSTADDLLIWNDALTNGRLGKYVTETLHKPATLNNGRKLGYARGLFLDTYRGTREIWHSGGAGGYSTWLGRYPEHGLSIAVMCNTDAMSTTALAHRIYALYVPATSDQGNENALPPIAAEGVDPAGLEVSSRAGMFFSESTGEPLRLVVDRGRLRVAGGPALVAQSNDRFKRWGSVLTFMSGDEFELQYLSKDQVELKSMEGKTTRYRRAQAYTPKADDLQAFTGRFGSDELGSVLQIEPKGDGLLMRLDHAPAKSLEFKAIDTDTFQFSGIIVRFRRDKTGKVVALDLSNPVVPNIKFTRLNAPANRS
ncbi:serine hydrolase [Fibrisoma montanum]|uniref:Serine hydrolase n=1 Tax=Fibrisoma montanum TaxID=2305895 RepID=A0A418M2S8_9BACT|nr:serine hydrolase [Fibrisoma montanum]RIV19994.1 serine hydrolase [Fibrisoma montanum]